MPYTDSLAAAASAVAAASASAAAAPGRHESSERAIAYTYLNESIVKTYGAVLESPALRGAIAWATRRSGRQVEFSGRSNRAIGFEQI